MRVVVEKRDHHGGFVWRYEGQLVEQCRNAVILDAQMGRDVPTDYVHFRIGDRMTEYFYADRWYNVFRIEDVDSKALKGWYCNITRPARIEQIDDAVMISADDLALDVFVTPAGAVRVLDEDEFAALPLAAAEQSAAWAAVDELRRLVSGCDEPFSEVCSPDESSYSS